MGTYSSIKDRVSHRIIDLPTAVQSEVGLLVNKALKKLQVRHNFQVMQATTSAIVTAPDTRILTGVVADFKEYRGKPYRISFSGGVTELLVVDQNQARQNYQEDQIGQPRFISEDDPTITGARNWLVWPLSDSASAYDDGEYRIYIPYWRWLPDLSADADTNWLTVYGEEYLVNQATSEGFAMDWDNEGMALWAQRAQNELADVVKQDKKLVLSKIDTLVPHWRGAREQTTAR
jgi:hypothetical protein